MGKSAFIALQDLEEVGRLMAKGSGAWLMAGGTDLLVLKRNRLIHPSSILYLKSIPGLAGIRPGEGGEVRIGALTTLDAVANDRLLKERFPILARAASSVASPQIRHKATIGGNICLNSRCWFYDRSPFWRAEYPECRKAEGGNKCYVVPASRQGCFALQSGDTVGPLVALGAKLRLISAGKERIVAMEDFFPGDGIRYLAIEPGEVLTEILLPPPAGKGLFIKFRAQDNLDFATFTLSLALAEKSGGVRIVVGSVASKPLRARQAEIMLEKGAPAAEVARQAGKELPLVSFVRGPVDFKKQVLIAYMTEAMVSLRGEGLK